MPIIYFSPKQLLDLVALSQQHLVALRANPKPSRESSETVELKKGNHDPILEFLSGLLKYS
jgi:hypothetical protein